MNAIEGLKEQKSHRTLTRRRNGFKATTFKKRLQQDQVRVYSWWDLDRIAQQSSLTEDVVEIQERDLHDTFGMER